jgi:excisionase family DNA binding protein
MSEKTKTDMTLDTQLTTHEVAAMIQVNPSSVCKWVREEKMIAHRTPGGHRRIRVSSLLAFLQQYETPVPKDLEHLVGALDAGQSSGDRNWTPPRSRGCATCNKDLTTQAAYNTGACSQECWNEMRRRYP